MKEKPFLIVEVGNTHTQFARATRRRLLDVRQCPTPDLGRLPYARGSYHGAIISSVVPAATRKLRRWLPGEPLEVSASIDLGIGIHYPNPHEIGADRLANAVGAVMLYGAPSIVVDFGTAVTFDIVNRERAYVGGVIAPGLAAMTEYLHEHTALLPKIDLREPRSVVGKSTVGAMQVGAVIGYRGLIQELLTALLAQPGMRGARVIATGGYGRLIARKLPRISHVNPRLTLEGLRFIYLHNKQAHPLDATRKKTTKPKTPKTKRN